MGRKPRIDRTKFSAFMDGVPDDLTNNGYWKIAREHPNEKSGGIIRSYLGFIEFEVGQDYDTLRKRVKEFAMKKGLGTYLCIPCGDDKKELKKEGMVKFTFGARELGTKDKESDVDDDNEDPMKMMQRTQADILKLKKMRMSEKMMSKMLGDDEDDDKKEETIKENPMDAIMMAKLLGGDDKKSDIDALKFIEMMNVQNQRMMEMVRTQEPAKNEMADFLKMMEARRGEEETRRREEQHKRDEERKDREHRMEIERKEREKREEEERKEERRRWEEQIRIDREKYDREMKEQRLRAEEDSRLRREELRVETDRNRQRMQEEREYQFKMMEIMQSRNEGSTKATTELIGQITKGAMGSMTMASQAAETIMSVARNATPSGGGDKEEGLGDVVKSLAGIAGPLLGGMASKGAQPQPQPQLSQEAIEGLQLLERVGGVNGLKTLVSRAQANPQVPQKTPQRVRQAPNQAQAPAPQVQAGGTQEQHSKEAEMVIAQFVKANPYIKDAIIGNIQDDRVPVSFVLRMLTEFDHPVVESVLYALASMSPAKLQSIMSESCETKEERDIIEKAGSWFVEFKEELLDELSEDEEEEEEEGEEVEENKEPEPEKAKAEEPKVEESKPEVKEGEPEVSAAKAGGTEQ